MKDDIEKVIRLLESCEDYVFKITNKTIYAFLSGYFSNEIYNDYFESEDLFGKYASCFELDNKISQGLKQLLKTKRVGRFKCGKYIYYYSVRYGKLSKKQSEKVNLNVLERIIDDDSFISFSLNDLKLINELTFESCMEEFYYSVDEKYELKADRVYSWIDSFRVIKRIISAVNFSEDAMFCFEYRLDTKYRKYYLDLVIKDDPTIIIEFKQKNVDEVSGKLDIIKKLKDERTEYQNSEIDFSAKSYIVCTKEPDYETKVVESEFVVSPLGFIYLIARDKYIKESENN